MQSKEKKYPCKSIVYSKFGDPLKVISIKQSEISLPKDDEVLVHVLAAPINPIDFLIMKNLYSGVPTKFPAVGGTEAVGKVIEIGSNVKTLKKDDHVIIPFQAPVNLGTWSTYCNYPEDCLMPCPKAIDLPMAATFSNNPATAYLMLTEFVKLKPGGTVIQNGANSALGQLVHQFCKIWSVNSIGIIRKRSNQEEHNDLCYYLKSLGASEVLTAEELEETTIFDSKFKKPILALNCIGGKTTNLMAKNLDYKGVLVTYGLITSKPVSGSALDFLVNDISFRGFTLAGWFNSHTKDERLKLYEELLKLVLSGKIHVPKYKMIEFQNFETAFETAISGNEGKIILNFQNV